MVGAVLNLGQMEQLYGQRITLDWRKLMGLSVTSGTALPAYS